MKMDGRSSDLEQIFLLKARYFRFIDTKQWGAFRELFSPDASLFYPETIEKPMLIEDIIGPFEEFFAGAVSIHHGHMPEIEFETEDRATGIWAMADHVYFSPERARETGIESFHGFGHYHEEYVRRDGKWFIQSLKLTRLRYQRCAPACAIG